MEGRGILTGPSRETPYTYSCFTSSVRGAMAVYEDARETQTSQRQQGLMAHLGAFGFSTIIMRVGHFFQQNIFPLGMICIETEGFHGKMDVA